MAKGGVMAAKKRKGMSLKLRFEVFKRDAFTCQYCGEKAPDVILHVDHIKPVAEGGTNEIVNLVTACVNCNSGKGKREISDSSVVKKQQKQLETLNERRVQLEMMANWRTGLSSIDKDVLAEMCSALEEVCEISLTDVGKANVKKWMKQFTPQEIMEAAKESFAQYIRYDKNDQVIPETQGRAFSKIGRLAHYRKNGGMSEQLKQGFYVATVLANRGVIRDWEKKETALKMEKVFSIEKYAPSFEAIKNLAKSSGDFDEFCEFIAALLRESSETIRLNSMPVRDPEAA